jgi:osmotically-inducible protein OsmY
MKTEQRLQKDVVGELEASQGTGTNGIEVSVNDGTVLLRGRAPTYTAKYAAERAVLRVSGVRVVSDGVCVREDHGHGDEKLAKAVTLALEQTPGVPPNVQATVEDGWVTLQGEVTSSSQMNRALNAVRIQAGVERIYNLMTVKPTDECNAMKM